MKVFVVCFLFLSACASLTSQKESTAIENAPKGVVVTPVSPEANVAAPNGHLNRYISRNTVRGIDFAATITKVAFGSDADQNRPQPIWKTIESTNPDLFLFMGNNISAASSNASSTRPDQYRQLDQLPEYKSFRMKVPFMAMWDEQDMSPLHADSTAPDKESAKTDFLNYWSYVRNSLPMEQLQKGGLYHAKTIGPKNKIVQVIMLDTRFYRSPLKDSKAPLLGEEQWRFLEKQLRQKANLRLIVSHLPAVVDGNPALPSWNDFARERDRFFDLLRKTGARNIVILSGDSSQWRVALQDIRGWGTLYNVTPGPLNPLAPPATFGLATIDWGRKTVRFELRDSENKAINSFDLRLKN